jgi:two-component system, OmpR family, response regulator
METNRSVTMTHHMREKSVMSGLVELMPTDHSAPGGDGLSICCRLRAASPIPIVLPTARGADVDRIVGVKIGADDYVIKLFNSRELVARIRALLRRARRGRDGLCSRGRSLAFCGWRIDLAMLGYRF